MVVVLLKLAERLADVAGDGRFFRDDECFTHLMRRNLAEKFPFVNTRAQGNGFYQLQIINCKIPSCGRHWGNMAIFYFLILTNFWQTRRWKNQNRKLKN
jgi:hypothetical protein